MEALQNVGPFILVLGIIIFVHEFGHFITAKAFGMRVFIFSFGFGKRLVGFKWGDTDYRVSLVPLGGYVKLEGEPEDHLSEDTSALGDGKDFTARPRWQKFLVYLAGPFMNAALTVGVLTVFHMIGFGVDASLYDPPIVGVVKPGGAAAAAGFQPGDLILSVGGDPTKSWEEVQFAVLLRPDRQVPLRVRRGAEETELRLSTPSAKSEAAPLDRTVGLAPLVRIASARKGTPAEEAGLQAGDGILQIAGEPIGSFDDIPPLVAGSAGKPLRLKLWRADQVFEQEITPRVVGAGLVLGLDRKVVVKKFGFLRSVKESVVWSWDMTLKTFDVLRRLLTAQLSPKAMMGPLGIAKESGRAAREGPGELFFLVAMISLQVGILNLFPLAPLDGGHLAIIAGEGLIRRDLSLDVKAWIMNAGALLLLGLIMVVVYSDLSKTSFLSKYLP